MTMHSQHVELEMPPLEEIVRRIVQRFRPVRVMLFGSHARGEAGPDSDLDLFVEMESAEPPRERRLAVRELFRHRAWPLDVVVYTPAEVRALRGRQGTLLETIEREGRVLYERG